MPRLVPGLVVFRRVRVVLDDLRDRRLVDAVQTLVPFSQLTVAPASTEPQTGINDSLKDGLLAWAFAHCINICASGN